MNEGRNVSDLNGYKKFEVLMAEFSQSFLTPLVEKKLTEPDFYTSQTDIEFVIFNGYSEISNSLETLRLIELFLNIPPPDVDGINYSNYLTYHVHNYLQEMYILKERLKTYLTKIQRKYNKVLDNEILKNIISPLINIVTSSLSGITGKNGVRHEHVHSEKFKDDELNWLSSTIFLADFHDEFTMHSKEAYETAKNKWFTIVKNNNIELNKLVDIYFDTIYSIITVDGKVVLPSDRINSSNKAN